MAPRLQTLMALAFPAITTASLLPHREVTSSLDSITNPGFVSFPIQRGDKTLSARDATASLINEADTSYLIQLTFGSNAQPVKVAIDTGSDELFVNPNCNDKDFSSAIQQECTADGQYDPGSSSSSHVTSQTAEIVYGSGAVELQYVVDSVGIPGTNANMTNVQFGMAVASDPSRIQICDLSNTFEDPLARAVRRRLKLSSSVASGIPIVYSTERTAENVRLLPLDEEEFQKGKVEELSALEQFRVRILPCLGPLPGMFGQAIAAYIVSDLGGLQMEPLAIKHRPKVYRSVYNALSAMEQRLHGTQKIPFSEQDVEYLVDELHRGRSIVSPEYRVPTKPALARWKKDSPLTWSNCVLFERDEADKHEKRCLVGDEDPESVWGEETAKLVSKRQDEERETRHYRL